MTKRLSNSADSDDVIKNTGNSPKTGTSSRGRKVKTEAKRKPRGAGVQGSERHLCWGACEEGETCGLWASPVLRL